MKLLGILSVLTTTFAHKIITIAPSDYTGNLPYDVKCDGIEDDIEIQAAMCEIQEQTYVINPAKTACGGWNFISNKDLTGEVKLLEGVFNIHRQILVYSNIHLYGAGMNNTILKLADNARSFYDNYYRDPPSLGNGHSGFIRVFFDDNVVLSDLTIDGNKDNQQTSVLGDEFEYGRYGFYSEASYNITVKNTRVRNWQGYGLDPHGVGGKGEEKDYGRLLYVYDNHVELNDWDGITLDKTLNIFCFNNIVMNNGRHGINVVTGSKNVRVYNNKIYNNGYAYKTYNKFSQFGCGVMAQNNQNYGVNDVYVYDNYIDNSFTGGICFNSVTQSFIYNNIVHNSKYCVSLSIQSDNVEGSKEIEIYDNLCQNNNEGIYIKSSTNNSIHDNTISTIDTPYGVLVNEKYDEKTNNIYNNTFLVTYAENNYIKYSDGLFDDTEEIPDPICENGILWKQDICCASTCINKDGLPQCGGSGCSTLEGGSSGCCTSTILNSNRHCSTHSPPCIM